MLCFRRKRGRVPGTVQPLRSQGSLSCASKLSGRGTGAVRGLMRECAGQFGFLGIVHRGIIRPCPLPLTGLAAQSLRSVVASAA